MPKRALPRRDASETGSRLVTHPDRPEQSWSPAVMRYPEALAASPLKRLAIHSFWLGEAWRTLPKPIQTLTWSVIFMVSVLIARAVGVPVPNPWGAFP